MKKKILFVAPMACYPSYKGNSARVAAVYEQMLNCNYDVYYLHLPEGKFDPEPMIARLGEKYIYQNFRANTFKLKLILKLIKAFILGEPSRHFKIDDFIYSRNIRFYKKILKKVNPDIVWVNYAYYSKLFDHTPASTLKILDTIDSVYLRFKNIFQNRPGYRSLTIDLSDEINCINRADVVVCIQPAEEQFFLQNGCIKKTVTLGHFISFTPTRVMQKRNNLLFLASDFFVYRDAINLFLKNIWPKLCALRPNTHLFIAGKICSTLNKQALTGNVTVLGMVPDLYDLYDSIDITLNPVAEGSGLKIKIIESLSFGKPVVTYPIGIEGLENFENKGVIIARNDDEWIKSVTVLLNDTERYNEQIASLGNKILKYNEANINIFKKMFNH